MPTSGHSPNLPSSFRDPSGFLFYEHGELYRRIHTRYREHYDALMGSGLYKALTGAGLLIGHEECGAETKKTEGTYKVVKPEPVPFISYPYEWCFSQLKDAALTMLEIQKRAFHSGMSLKDASAYNIQFMNGHPILIDTLSFEKYQSGQPWVAYRQFCQHFLAPLALMSLKDIRLSSLLRVHLDGIPLDLASRLLPCRTFLRFPLLMHIHLHALSQRYFAGKKIKKTNIKLPDLSALGLVDSLESAVQSLKWRPQGTEWGRYYEDTNYSSPGYQHKKQIVSDFLDTVKPGRVWDLGANTGIFSEIAASKGMEVISFDGDPAAVEKNYLSHRPKERSRILPLVLDLTNPSPAAGWDHRERMSLAERGPSDVALALALVHHLAISHNIPLGMIAEYFSGICKTLLIEFVPKEDSQVQRLLSARVDVFSGYDQQAFEREFGAFFTLKNSVRIKDSHRVLYLMLKK